MADLVVSEDEDMVVQTAASLFSEDVVAISNRTINIVSKSKSEFQIVVGTVGVSKNFDQKCDHYGIDLDRLKKSWERYILKSVKSQDGDGNVLLVVGSNPRGTAFGLMKLSEMIGVSPWVWWADVLPEKQETISLPIDLEIEDSPKVKFRGIFLNDEDWGLQPWAAKTYEPETGDIGPKTYGKIFELLLRLKANMIWPAMHDCTRAFFTYPDNIKMADKYGIWVGSSHCEPMLRNNVDEWKKWDPTIGKRGKWNFDENPDQITEYWKQRVETTASYDGIYTVGMRGIHDGGMPGGNNIDDKVKILSRVLKTQRSLLANIVEKEITTIPQIFCPYKEVLKLYKAGAEIPEDITMMWADDNNGYIRQLSNEDERMRKGGAGVYYHISYWGRPHDYLWLESIPVSLIWEEMYKAYQTDAKNVWIVNVGDIKSNEIGMNFFLEMAWDPEQFSSETLGSYYTRFSKVQFGNKYAEEIGGILRKYFQLAFSRKPEHLGWNGVYPNTAIHDPELSLFCNGDEVQQRIDAYDQLEKQVSELSESLPENLRDAFYQLVAYKVIGASNMNKKIMYAYKSRVYANQGRTSSNLYAQKSKTAFEKIKRITTFYNDSLASGKWKYMMTYNPRELPVFAESPTGSYTPTQKVSGGIIPEGFSSPPDSNGACLPVFNSFADCSYFIDVFNKGNEPLKWEAESSDEWIKLSKKGGKTDMQERVWISINWNELSQMDTVQSKIIFKLKGNEFPVYVKAVKSSYSATSETVSFENNGLISIQAEDYTKLDNKIEKEWKIIQGLGLHDDAIGAFPATAKDWNQDVSEDYPVLIYDFISTSTGEASLSFYCLPNHPINDDYELRFEVVLDDGEPIIINAALEDEMDEHNTEWQQNVLQSFVTRQMKTVVKEKGKHHLKIKMIDPGVVLDKIEIKFLEN